MHNPIVEYFIIDEYKRLSKDHLEPTETDLGIPSGTLSSIITDTDYLSAIKMTSTIEPILNSIIEKSLKDKCDLLFDPSNEAKIDKLAKKITRNYTSLSDKSDTACILGAITQEEKKFVQSIGKLRNRYAHNIENCNKSLDEITEKCILSDKNFNKVYLNPYSLDINTTMQQNFKIIIFFNFCIFISKMQKYNIKNKFVMGSIFAINPTSTFNNNN